MADRRVSTRAVSERPWRDVHVRGLHLLDGESGHGRDGPSTPCEEILRFRHPSGFPVNLTHGCCSTPATLPTPVCPSSPDGTSVDCRPSTSPSFPGGPPALGPENRTQVGRVPAYTEKGRDPGSSIDVTLPLLYHYRVPPESILFPGEDRIGSEVRAPAHRPVGARRSTSTPAPVLGTTTRSPHFEWGVGVADVSGGTRCHPRGSPGSVGGEASRSKTRKVDGTTPDTSPFRDDDGQSEPWKSFSERPEGTHPLLPSSPARGKGPGGGPDLRRFTGCY